MFRNEEFYEKIYILSHTERAQELLNYQSRIIFCICNDALVYYISKYLYFFTDEAKFM